MLRTTLQATLLFQTHWIAASAVYTPFREYSGTTFFDKWDYYGNIDDKTWGNVTFVDQANATSLKLVDVNAAGNAIIKVDNTTNITAAPLVHRNSVRITSQDAYPIGSVIIADMLHMPYGCSVWPSFWLLGTNLEWPDAGEIDIVEGINMYDKNQMSLHTTEGCKQAAPVTQVGKTLVSDCLDIAGTNNNGCVTEETKANSYGQGFATAGGGVYAVQIDVSGVYMWFWSRANIPATITSATSTSTLDLSDWGTASAAYPATACNITQFFQPQKMIFDITLCGAWAGFPSLYKETCPGDCIANNIIGPGSPTYDNAFFEIKYIRTYTAGDVATPSSSAQGSAASGASKSGSTSPSASAGTTTVKGSSGAIRVVSGGYEAVLAFLSVLSLGWLGL
ncbi:concanavalin A-like lectin/glucanase domain-containing protein [Mycena sp. CBHHK59/15]|nr:concanavalin A-like lectin/glucanase domain-containing protein [Mycena sp. CBHHK59/15]